MKKDIRENKMITGLKSDKAEGKPSVDKKGEIHGKKNLPTVK